MSYTFILVVKVVTLVCNLVVVKEVKFILVVIKIYLNCMVSHLMQNENFVCN